MSTTPDTASLPVLQELNAFVDGELALSRQIEIEARLPEEAALRNEIDRLRALRDVVRAEAEYHPLPTAWRMGLPHAASAATPVDEPTAANGSLPHIERLPSGLRDAARRWLAWRPLISGFALAGLLATGLDRWQPGLDERLMQEIVASHVRSTVGQRLVDVASSDRHTVKPWLSSHLDYSPPVGDVTGPELSFVGGRIDYLDGRPVAALVYRQRQHVIDAYIWPGAGGDAGMQTASQRGFNSVQWRRGGMRFWLVSDLNAAELGAFAQSLDRADGAR